MTLIATDSIAARLRASRAMVGLDQSEIAERIGVSRSAVSSWEVGRSEPGATSFILWAQVTGQSMEWLAEGVMCARRDSNPQPSDLYSLGYDDFPSWSLCPICGNDHDVDDCPDFDRELGQLLAVAA